MRLPKLTMLEKGAVVITSLFLAFSVGARWGTLRVRDSFSITTQQEALSAQVGTERVMPELSAEPEGDEEPALPSMEITVETSRPVSAALTDRGDKVNINTAGVEELTRLKGIGQSLAGRIVAYREENGPFARIEDITLVSGIGEGIFRDIRDDITVD